MIVTLRLMLGQRHYKVETSAATFLRCQMTDDGAMTKPYTVLDPFAGSGMTVRWRWS